MGLKNLEEKFTCISFALFPDVSSLWKNEINFLILNFVFIGFSHGPTKVMFKVQRNEI